MKYYRTYTSTPIENYLVTTEKAIRLTIDKGYGWQKEYVWLPKSQIRWGEVNEVGNIPMFIPMWLLKDVKRQIHRIEEFQAMPEIVEL